MGFLARFDELHDLASRDTDLHDFGPDDYHAPLRLLLADYDAHARFTPLGVQITQGNLVGLLASRLRAQDALARHPHPRHTPTSGRSSSSARCAAARPPCTADAFPDACVVWTHREPVGAMVSAAAIFLAVRGVIESLPRERIGCESMTSWAAALAQSERVRRRLDPARFLDVHMDDLRRDPLAVAERIHEYFDLPVSDRQRQGWAAYVARQPDAGHVSSRLTPADLGFTADDVHRAVGEYAERYDRLQDHDG
ncbi:MAG TPA: sulfotransferase [Nevskiaceae bacterium]|nr:sulfotransferase [Nevskiaceae bacterium]